MEHEMSTKSALVQIKIHQSLTANVKCALVQDMNVTVHIGK